MSADVTNTEYGPAAALRAVLERDRILAILRYPQGGDIASCLAAVLATGLGAGEVTADTPGGLDAIAQEAAKGHLVGLGTVLTPAKVRDCQAAGGSFVVSPAADPDVIRQAKQLGLAVIPGVMSPTEVALAERLGVRLLKLFPAGNLGPGYLRALLGPFAGRDFLPTGGISQANAAAFLEAGALALGVGGDLFGRVAPDNADQLAQYQEAVTEKVRQFQAQLPNPTGQLGEHSATQEEAASQN
ncbi:MAG: bifunctional 4-hydroxy-2-oxoglutarate aldolase/2-dehydro-3-deoxy-phosphogluconate aldolase [Bifidobacteriaceae bacterium]|jgi:2-dehydro-3-deoxyphosphogluconate aldolase/(4S)-4-hydroxy-2-oxoglutarate aldolase|nr:bifunctional 4-hydroxy-2-oxoglutarate aldolase/2-dehydro-3-deoxy-phosphogluconate aldolase [Bifidobacteriaceae bacterium]